MSNEHLQRMFNAGMRDLKKWQDHLTEAVARTAEQGPSQAPEATFFVVAAPLSRTGIGPFASREEAEQHNRGGSSYFGVYEITVPPKSRGDQS